MVPFLAYLERKKFFRVLTHTNATETWVKNSTLSKWAKNGTNRLSSTSWIEWYNFWAIWREKIFSCSDTHKCHWKLGPKIDPHQMGQKWYQSIQLVETNRMVPFLAYLERKKFFVLWHTQTQLKVMVKNRPSPNGLKMVPIDAARRAESNGTIFSLFGEKKFFRALTHTNATESGEGRCSVSTLIGVYTWKIFFSPN